MRNSEGQQKEDRVSYMIFADNCYLFAESQEQVVKIVDATEELRKRGLDWKEAQMYIISWDFVKKLEICSFDAGGKII